MEIEKSIYNLCQEGQGSQAWVLPDSCPSTLPLYIPLPWKFLGPNPDPATYSHMDLENVTSLPVSLFVKLGNNSSFEG